MKVDRLTRINALLKREIAEVLFREMAGEGAFDPSAVTVTRVEVSSNLRHARVAVSFRGGEAEARRGLSLLRHHRAHIQKRVQQKVVLKYSPVFEFVHDSSLAEGDRVLALLSDLEEAEPARGDVPPAGEPPDSDRT